MATTIELLNQIKTKNALPIYVPSLGVNIPFSHLTFQHYNELLALDTIEEDTIVQTFKLNELIDKIIFECCLEKIDNLTIIDRDIIALQLRVAIDDHFTVINNDTSTDVSLKEHCKSLNKLGNFKEFINKTVSHDSIELTLNIPTTNIDKQVNTEILAFNRDSEQFPSFLLFSEIIKYISQIKVGEAEPVKLYQPDNITESIFICQQLPLPLLNKVSEYISNVQKEEQKLMSVQVIVPSEPSKDKAINEGHDASDKNVTLITTFLIPVIINVEWFTNI